MKSRPIKEKRLDGLESDFEPLLISCLRECAGGRWGLFGQNDASEVARYCQWDEAEQLKEIANKIQELRAEFGQPNADRKSTRLNSSHLGISYAVFCLKKKTHIQRTK